MCVSVYGEGLGDGGTLRGGEVERRGCSRRRTPAVSAAPNEMPDLFALPPPRMSHAAGSPLALLISSAASLTKATAGRRRAGG